MVDSYAVPHGSCDACGGWTGVGRRGYSAHTMCICSDDESTVCVSQESIPQSQYPEDAADDVAGIDVLHEGGLSVLPRRRTSAVVGGSGGGTGFGGGTGGAELPSDGGLTRLADGDYDVRDEPDEQERQRGDLGVGGAGECWQECASPPPFMRTWCDFDRWQEIRRVLPLRYTAFEIDQQGHSFSGDRPQPDE